MPEPRRLRIQGPAELAGLVPHLWHYTPGEGQVAAMGAGATGMPGLVSQPGHTPGATEARHLLEHVDRDATFLLVGYGATGRRNAADFADAIRDELKGNARIAVVAAVDDGRVSALVDGRWDDFGNVRDMSEHFVLEGSDPAPSRDAHRDRFLPLSTPEWAPAEAGTAAAVASMMPTQRADRARRILDALAVPGNRVDDVERAWLATAADGDGIVRDAIMQHGWDRDRGFALVSLYRGAPLEHRDATAALAGAAMFARGDMVAARTIVDQIAPDSRHASFGDVVRTAIDVGAPPGTLTDTFDRAEIDRLLDQADHSWGDRIAARRASDVLRHQAPATDATSKPLAASSYRPGASTDPPSLER